MENKDNEETKAPEAGAKEEQVVKELPKDIFSDKMPDGEVLPLNEEVKTKDYGQLPSDAGNTGAAGGGASAIGADGSQIPPGVGGSGGQLGGVAPAAPAISPEQIKTQAQQTVDMMLKGYEKLHGLGRWIGKIDQNELVEMHVSGKIDLEQQLPIGNKSIAVKEFFAEYNDGIDENISVSQEFKDKITPPLERICIKNNWLLSDEYYVGALLAEDLTTKVSLLIGLKKSANLVLGACVKIMQNKNAPKSKPGASHEDRQEHPSPGDGRSEWKEPEEAHIVP